MQLFDTHCHVNDEAFTNEENIIIQQAQEYGVTRMVVVGCDRQGIERALKLAENHTEIYVAAAWHPVDVIDCSNEDKKYLQTVWQHPKVVAIGETGLDYHWEKSPHALQKDFFMWHVEMACQHNLPFIVHDRDAHGDTLHILQTLYQKHGTLKGIMHSYSGSKELALEFLKLGLYISISGVVTFKNAKHIKEVVPIVPENRLLLETDAPYLTPVPFRGKRNEPAYVKYIAETVAELRETTVEHIAQITTRNAQTIFNV